MPSPFPGMDPYLESSYWSNFHGWLAPEIAGQLNPLLRPKYAAIVQKRIVVVDRADISLAVTYPDIGIVAETKSGYRPSRDTALIDPPFELSTSIPEEIPHLWVDIQGVDNHELVTSIEILSPWNKIGRGRDEYLVKREAILMSTVHLLEIDLVRQGRRLPAEGELPAASYYVFLSRSDQRPKVGIWPVQLQDRLPTVPVPLRKGDPDVLLDLQAALRLVYDKSSYDLLIDYRTAPPVPLNEREQRWVAETVVSATESGRKS